MAVPYTSAGALRIPEIDYQYCPQSWFPMSTLAHSVAPDRPKVAADQLLPGLALTKAARVAREYKASRGRAATGGN